MKELSVFIDESGDFGEPVIRREGIFATLSVDDRRKLIYKMLNFTVGCAILHETVVVNRKEADNKLELSGKLATEISKVLTRHTTFFDEYEKIIVYYDNGQIELGSILNAVFSSYFTNVEFRKAEPQRYRLLQVADFICSLELLRVKWKENRLSNSEQKFFYKPQELKKVFLKAIDKKRL